MFLTRITALALLCCCITSALSAQDIWSLQRCIQYARDNSLTIKQTQANVHLALLSEQQAKSSRLPNVSGSVDAGEQFGRTIDPTTNTFSPNATGFNSLRLSASAQVFSGGLVHHSVKQADWNVQAAQADAEQTMNNLGLQIAQAYLNILLAEEQLKTADRRVTQSKEQLKITLKFIDAGTLPMADKFTSEAQLARDEQTAVTMHNSVDLAYLNLKQLLQLEPDYDLRLERPATDILTDALPADLSLSPIYTQATLTQPGVRAAGFRMKSAEEGVAIAKAGYYPTVSLFANLSSNYSTRYPDYSRVKITGVELGPVEVYSIGGQDVPVRRYNATYELPTLGYFNQIDQNFGQGIGVNVNIPIYQNGRTRLSVERARLQVLNSEIQNLQTHQQLKNDIQTAVANVRAGHKQMEAARKTLSSLQTAYQNMEKRFSIGAVNAFDLSTAHANLNAAENDLLVARYDYLFRLKILDFYQGRPLLLN